MKKFFFLFFLIFSTVFGNSGLKDFNDFKNEFIKHNHNSTTPSAEFDNNYFHEVDFEVDTEMNLSMNHFFENSLNFAPKNHISCGFVSLIQVLSFYDTFYNDSIIPNQYEYKKTNVTSLSQLTDNSPGVFRENNYISPENYENYCRATATYNFQSYLTTVYNDGVLQNSSIFESSMHMNEYDDLFSCLTTSVLRYANFIKFNAINTHHPIDSEQIFFREFIIENIMEGRPVIVHVRKSCDSTLHSVVAYKVINNEIYANYGWNTSYDSNRKLLIDNGQEFDSIYSVGILTFPNLTHSHSDNYVLNNFKYCGCGYSENYFVATSSDWNNVPATFTWMKNPNDSTEEYYLYFKLSIDGPTIYTYNTSSNRVTFSLNSWTIIRNYTSTYLYVFLERNGQNSDDELIYLIINDPYLDMDSDIFTASNFNYNSTIASNEIYEQTIYCENMNLNYNISSTATYEEGESIIMSAKQAGIMTSFLEIEAEEIYRVDLNYNLYSNNEFVSHDVTEFKLQYMSNETNDWIDFVDLLDFASENNRMLKIIFPHSVSKIRFLLSPNVGMNYLNGRIEINSIELFMDN